MGGKQTVPMKCKGYGGPMGGPMPMGSPLGAPIMGYPSEPMMGATYMQAPMMETTYMQAPMMESTYMQAPMMSAGPTMMAPQLPAGYYEPGMATTTTTSYPAMGMGMMPAQTMGAVMPNNNKWKVTMRSKGNAPPMGLPAGAVYGGNEHFDYKMRERSGGLFSHGPKSSVHIKERHHGAGGGYYGGSVMPAYTTVASPMVGAMPQYYQEEALQQYPYGAYGG